MSEPSVETFELVKKLSEASVSLPGQPESVREMARVLAAALPSRYGNRLIVPNYVGDYLLTLGIQMNMSKHYELSRRQVASELARGFFPLTFYACPKDFAISSFEMMKKVIKEEHDRHLSKGLENKDDIIAYIEKELFHIRGEN